MLHCTLPSKKCNYCAIMWWWLISRHLYRRVPSICSVTNFTTVSRFENQRLENTTLTYIAVSKVRIQIENFCTWHLITWHLIRWDNWLACTSEIPSWGSIVLTANGRTNVETCSSREEMVLLDIIWRPPPLAAKIASLIADSGHSNRNQRRVGARSSQSSPIPNDNGPSSRISF